eukprot:CAMPEP_0114535800 /NCGR_PEP_ID=MMETSP0109-20121206/28633_1 /TAXON_ID=29199 /ORGANISM="Chlorarachnion reptans, Strain CCCM449" /LENGTH=333 /DNA_ID=CAMNT_0001719437 /DNA_START=63 /DNA_END=1065 /DNA_ORIENTATION=-
MSSDEFSSDSEEELTKEDLQAISIQKEVTSMQKARFQGAKIINGFQILSTLGQGGFATVKRAKFCPTGDLYAVKKIRKGWLKKKREWTRKEGKMVMYTMLDKVMQGIDVLKDLGHDHIIKLHSVINDPGEDSLFLWDVDDLKFKSTVFKRGQFGGIELGAVAHVVDQAAKGLEYLHKQHVVHRDIKPDNLLVTENWVVKIADFGVSKKLTAEEKGILQDTQGTYPFMSPEIAAGKKYDAYMADVWALGVTFFALIFAKVPYFDQTHHKLFEMIKTEPVKIPSKVDQPLEGILMKVLEKEPTKRLTAADVQNDSWIREHLKKGFTKRGKSEEKA